MMEIGSQPQRFREFTEGLEGVAVLHEGLAIQFNVAAESVHSKDPTSEFLFEAVDDGRSVRVGFSCSDRTGDAARIATSEFYDRAKALGYSPSAGSFAGNGGVVYFERTQNKAVQQ